jgi:hypothetical protein
MSTSRLLEVETDIQPTSLCKWLLQRLLKKQFNFVLEDQRKIWDADVPKPEIDNPN